MNSCYRIIANRTELSAASDYFKALFGPNFIEKDQNEIILSSFDSETLNRIVNYCHSSEIELTGENIESIIEAARSMTISSLEEKCCQFLQTNMQIDDCISAFYISDLYCLNDVRANLFEFISKNCEQIDVRDFQILSAENLQEFLKCKYLMTTEDNLLQILMQWIASDEKNRTKLFDELIESIDLDSISFKVIANIETFLETRKKTWLIYISNYSY